MGKRSDKDLRTVTRDSGKGHQLGESESSRNVEFILYPDHIILPPDVDGKPMCTPHGRIVSFFESSYMKAVLSPLHDRDEYGLEDIRAWRKRYSQKFGLTEDAEEVLKASPKLGQKKEPHYHLGCFAAGPHKAEWWVDFISDLYGDYPRWRIWTVSNPDSYVRYMSHKDSPSKARYKDSDVLGFGGMDLSPLSRTDEVEKIYASNDIREYIRTSGCKWYDELLDWAYSTGDQSIVNNVLGNVTRWDKYMSSRVARIRAGKKRGCEETVEGLIG